MIQMQLDKAKANERVFEQVLQENQSRGPSRIWSCSESCEQLVGRLSARACH